MQNISPSKMKNRPPRELEKCRIPQDISHMAKRQGRRNTWCISRERRKAIYERDKEDGALEVSEEV